MPAVKVKDNVHWVGVLDPLLRLFDDLFPTNTGTTYNSYLVRGTEGVAVIDTVKGVYTEEFLDNVRSLVDPKKITYIVVNHTEPDHSGALAALLQEATQAQLLISKSGERFMKGLLNASFKSRVVEDGDTFELGGKTLRIITAPFLHWPDTIFTYLVEDRILFTCDAFGSHYCDPRLFDDQVGDFSRAMWIYFDGIVRPFREYVLQAGEKVRDLEGEVIAPSHGPILRNNPGQYVARYVEWSTMGEEERRVLVLYLSSHGNTRQMAEAVARGVKSQGVEAVVLHVTEEDPDRLWAELERSDGVIFGTPTINRDVPAPMWQTLALLSSIKMQGDTAAAFGSYGWSGEAVPMMEERFKALKLKVPAKGVKVNFTPTEEDLKGYVWNVEGKGEGKMDSKTFYKISYGLYVVSSRKNGRFNGQIANTVFQVASEPPTIAVCINKQNLTHEFFRKSQIFTVSILSKETPLNFIGHFGFKSGRELDKFKDVNYRIGVTDAPVVMENAIGYLEAEVMGSMDAGTHTLFLGRVVEAEIVEDGEPMTYAYYHEIKQGITPKTAPVYLKDEGPKEGEIEKYRCPVCGYVYDPEVGDPDSGIDP